MCCYKDKVESDSFLFNSLLNICQYIVSLKIAISVIYEYIRIFQTYTHESCSQQHTQLRSKFIFVYCKFGLSKNRSDNIRVYSEDMTFFGCLWRTCFVRGSLASGHVVVRYSGEIHGAQFVQTSRLKMNIQIQFVILQYIHPCQ